jgi:phytol kinase
MTVHDGLAMAAVSGVLVALLFFSSGLARRGKLSPELARKTVHTGMGLLCLPFPWLFSGPLPVVLLGLLALTVMLIIRRSRALRGSMGASLHGVERQSTGELMFPLAVAAVFVLAEGRKEFFLIPVLVLALADALSALYGSRHGNTAYLAWKGRKSIEGSFLFFAVAFACSWGPLTYFTDYSRADVIWISLSVAVLSTAIEGILGDGWDNLMVPLGVFLILDQLDARDSDARAMSALVFFLLFSILWFCRKWSSLNGGALLAALLYGASCLAWGGHIFLAGPIAMFLLHVLVTSQLKGRVELSHAAGAIFLLAVPVLGVLVLLHHGKLTTTSAFAIHTTILAAQSFMMHASTRRALSLPNLRVGFAFVKTVPAILLPALLLQPERSTAIGCSVALVLAWPVMFDARHHRPDLGPLAKGHHRRRAFVASLCGGITMGLVVGLG